MLYIYTTSPSKLVKMLGTKLSYKNIENRNYAKATMIDDLIFTLQNRLNVPHANLEPVQQKTVKEYNTHVTNYLQWDDNPTTIPCLNIKCEWISFFWTFYHKANSVWPLPSDQLHPLGHCKVCQYITEQRGKRSKLKVVGGKQVLIC